jgi:hypothetical protein
MSASSEMNGRAMSNIEYARISRTSFIAQHVMVMLVCWIFKLLRMLVVLMHTTNTFIT